MGEPTETTKLLADRRKMFLREFSVRCVIASDGSRHMQQRIRDLDDSLIWIDIPVVRE